MVWNGYVQKYMGRSVASSSSYKVGSNKLYESFFVMCSHCAAAVRWETIIARSIFCIVFVFAVYNNICTIVLPKLEIHQSYKLLFVTMIYVAGLGGNMCVRVIRLSNEGCLVCCRLHLTEIRLKCCELSRESLCVCVEKSERKCL